MTAGEGAMVIAVIHEENGVFGVSFPDFPGCITGADAREESIRKASEALAFHVAGMLADGEEVPALRTISELEKLPEITSAVRGGAKLVVVPLLHACKCC
jgi:predicted RNase H-like HicB family nuclease